MECEFHLLPTDIDKVQLIQSGLNSLQLSDESRSFTEFLVRVFWKVVSNGIVSRRITKLDGVDCPVYGFHASFRGRCMLESPIPTASRNFSKNIQTLVPYCSPGAVHNEVKLKINIRAYSRKIVDIQQYTLLGYMNVGGTAPPEVEALWEDVSD